FNARVNSLIHALQSMGFTKGDVLGILSWNCLEYTDVYGAAQKGGFIASPFSPRLQEDELEYIINYSEANILFVGPELVPMANSLRPRLPKVKNFISLEGPAPDMMCHRDMLAGYPREEPNVQIEEDDPVFIFYTSGTTGIPRGALYTHRRAIEDTRTFVIGLGLEHSSKHVQIMPLFHVGGTKNFWGYFYVGGSNVIMPQRSFNPAATLQMIQDEKATDIHIVPTHLASFLALPDVDEYDLSSLRQMFYAASPMPLELLKKGMEMWGPIFVQAYGSTEDGPNVTTLSKQQHDVLDRPPEEQRILTSAGFSHAGVHVRIVDDRDNDVEPGEIGEIVVQSKSTMLEWWHKPDETRETVVNGWLHTGDMGRYDEKGYIYIVDRKHDMIVSGGENIYPREVEEIIYQHPSVQEAAVIGIPDPYWVEKVHGVVTLKQGEGLTARELIDFCKQRLARYKAPKSVEFVDALPKNPAGKILKRVLREKYWEGLERRV
ncbi:MAG: long-chain-fatty-acid--CoA ligase, partial [Desulfobacteraceae bacterium]|nr:long-chain-fatty-acid--CoA ligase [Desulfobacteraceae bacterium]